MKPLPPATTSRPFASVLVALVMMSVGLTAGTGCAPISPSSCTRGWKWLHPTMAATDMSGSAEAHVRSVNEGSAGGRSGTQSGNGSN